MYFPHWLPIRAIPLQVKPAAKSKSSSSKSKPKKSKRNKKASFRRGSKKSKKAKKMLAKKIPGLQLDEQGYPKVGLSNERTVLFCFFELFQKTFVKVKLFGVPILYNTYTIKR